ncbi:hypothetical protein CVIRNUC_002483 [Coccomyxa viridis]|uniref:GATA-type domain-containing protein n=1 Tax=Coccomyxa viridis TaxID=1274662 RepID=A0AAV1HW09_9CHLO|nr:hypothetical protein CVIRNUC_002483 [Coccomyxa viridis]
MLTMTTMLGPEPHSDREMVLESHSGLHGSLSPAARSSLEGDKEQLQHADNSTDRGVTAATDPAWTHIEEMGYMLGSLLFPADSPGIAQLIGTKTEYQVLMLEHSVDPGARKMQEKLNLMRQDSKFSTIRAEDFRNGALLENVMGALSPFNNAALEADTRRTLNAHLKGALELRNLTAYLTYHFGLESYFQAFANARKGAGGKPAHADRYAAQPLSELDPQQETWAEQAAPANVNRKVIKVKTKAQREKDAEKRELEPLRPSGCANCGVFWAPMPRQGMCNACGIYLTNNKRQRPLKLAEKLQQQEPWKFRPEVPPGHMLKLKDNGKEVAVPEEDVDNSPRTDGSDSQAPSRPASAAFMTAEEEAEAVRRSQRQRRPPAHLSSDDDALASDASDEDKRAARSAGARPHPFAQHPVERHDAPGSDDSDQSCYEDEDMDIIDLDEPEGHEHVKARYSHAAWSSPSDDSFFAESLLYLKHSQTPPRARKRMHEDMQAQAFPGSVEGPANDAYAACFVPAPAISAVEAFQAGGRPKRMKEKRKPKTGGPCTNCGTAMSSMWRPHNSKHKAGPTRCNACGIYITSYGMERPVDEHGNLDKAAAKKVSSTRANSRKRLCLPRETSMGSDATGQGSLPSRADSLPKPAPVPSAFAAPKAAPAGVFSISVDARGGPAAVLFEHAHTPTNRVAHLARQISAAGSGTLNRALFAAEKTLTAAAARLPAIAPLQQQL